MNMITIDRSVVQQALEALEDFRFAAGFDRPLAQDAIDALRAALAQQAEPVQEPVAWLQPKTVDAQARPDLGYETCSKDDYGAFPVYRALAQEQAKPVEQVAWRLWDEDPQGGGDWRYYDAKDFKEGIDPMKYFDGLVPLYLAPPQRKPLTEEEIRRICDAHWSLRQLVRAIERAHGIGEQP